MEKTHISQQRDRKMEHYLILTKVTNIQLKMTKETEVKSDAFYICSNENKSTTNI